MDSGKRTVRNTAKSNFPNRHSKRTHPAALNARKKGTGSRHEHNFKYGRCKGPGGQKHAIRKVWDTSS